MFFSVILILLIAIVFRKQKMAETGQQKSDEIEHLSKNKKELILGLAWYIFYFMLSYISCAYQVDIISELSNWLFLVFFPLLIIAVFRKEKVIQTLKETGLKHFDRKTVLRILLICAVYQGVIILVFGLGGFYFNITNILQILIKLPVFFCLMILTAAFTEEVFFRGILQRTMMDSLKKPYLAILLTGILFGLYHFPFAYYLWDDTAGNIMYSLRMVMTEHVLTGCAFGFIYYKSNKNLWSCIILHAFTNAAIMALGTVFST